MEFSSLLLLVFSRMLLSLFFSLRHGFAALGFFTVGTQLRDFLGVSPNTVCEISFSRFAALMGVNFGL